MKKNVSLEEARALLLEKASPVQECYVSLGNALGRVISQDITAGENSPPFTKSPLDGYALLAKDTKTAGEPGGVLLEVIEEVPAGYFPVKKIVPGTAIKVMTGAPLPEGADVVVRYEDAVRQENYIRLNCALQAGSNVIYEGEDIIKGETVANKGTLLTPPFVGLLASIGTAKVPVFAKVRVAVFSTGDELLDPAQKLQPGKIYNSNLHSLLAACQQLGTEPLSFGVVPDAQEATAERIAAALNEADIVITTGGVSVGDYDVVIDALKALEANIIFWRVDMKPGSPVVAAEKNNKLIICLSGNPAAAFITFDLLAVPVIKKMMGLSRHLPVQVAATFVDHFEKSSPQRRFLRARLFRQDETNFIKLTGKQSNGILKSLLDCNALIDVPAGHDGLTAGQKVSAVVVGSID